MKLSSASLSLASLTTVFALVAACGGDSSSASNEPTASTEDGGDTDAGTLGDGAASTAGTFWYVNHDVQTVGVADLEGNQLAHESIDEKPRGVVVGGGAAWILTDSGNVLRYDQKTRTKVTSIAVAKVPGRIVFGAGSVWVTDDNDGSSCDGVDAGYAKVVRIDPATNSVVAHISVSATDSFACDRFDGLASDGSSIYALVNNSFGLAQIDPVTNTVTKRLALGAGGGAGSGFLAVAGTKVWVHNTSANTIVPIDASAFTAAAPTSIPSEFLGQNWIATANAIYLDGTNDNLLRVDATNPATQTTFPLFRSPDAMVLHGDTLVTVYSESLEAQFVTYDVATLAEKARVSSLAYADNIAFE